MSIAIFINGQDKGILLGQCYLYTWNIVKFIKQYSSCEILYLAIDTCRHLLFSSHQVLHHNSKQKVKVTHNLSLLSLTFGESDSSYTGSISAVSSKLPVKLVFYKGLRDFLVYAYFLNSTFFELYTHLVCLQNTFACWLARRWRTAKNETKATTSQNPSRWKLQEKAMGQCPTKTVNSHLFSVYFSIL